MKFLAPTTTESSTPAGVIMPFGSSATAPAGWLFCQGQSLNASTNSQYRRLYNVIGTTYGGSGLSAFSLPDYQGRFLVGLGTNGTVNAITKNDGAVIGNRTPTHSHTVPSHYHYINSYSPNTTTASGSWSGSTNNTNLSHAHAGGGAQFIITSGSGLGSANISTGGGGYALNYTDGANINMDHGHSFSVSGYINGYAGDGNGSNGNAAFASGSTTTPFAVVTYIIKY